MESEYTMTYADLSRLREGDVLRSVSTGHTYVVTQNDGGVVTAVQTITVLRPDDWVLVNRDASHPMTEQRTLATQAEGHASVLAGIDPATATTDGVRWAAANRRRQDDAEDLDVAHTSMDTLVHNADFILRLRRHDADVGETAAGEDEKKQEMPPTRSRKALEG